MKKIKEEEITPYIGIVYGVLKQLHIYPCRPDYEDWRQTGLLILCECLQKVSLDFKTTEQAYRFRGVLFQLVKSRMIDHWRREQRQLSYKECYEEHTKKNQGLTISIEDTLVGQADYERFKEKLWPHLTEREREYLVASMEKDWSIPEIAHFYNVSRHAVYKWRNQVALKSLRYFLK